MARRGKGSASTFHLQTDEHVHPLVPRALLYRVFPAIAGADVKLAVVRKWDGQLQFLAQDVAIVWRRGGDRLAGVLQVESTVDGPLCREFEEGRDLAGKHA